MSPQVWCVNQVKSSQPMRYPPPSQFLYKACTKWVQCKTQDNELGDIVTFEKGRRHCRTCKACKPRPRRLLALIGFVTRDACVFLSVRQITHLGNCWVMSKLGKSLSSIMYPDLSFLSISKHFNLQRFDFRFHQFWRYATILKVLFHFKKNYNMVPMGTPLLENLWS